MAHLICKKNCYLFKLQQEHENIIRLIRSSNVSPRLFFRLISFFGSPKAALEHISDLSKSNIRDSKGKFIRVFSKNDFDKEMNKLEKIGAKVLTFIDPLYPNLLLQMPDPPPVLIYKGNVNLLTKNVISIVGSRNASLASQSFASHIAKTIVQVQDIVTCSGFAKGIDYCVHKSSVKNTIAVFAGSVSNIYPKEHEKLYHEIIEEGGVIVSEQPEGSKLFAHHFPLRNRIISGLSLTVVVIEAGVKSGALITAKCALEQGKEVMVAPGSPMDKRCLGSNKLIKEGAFVLSGPEDIIENIQSLCMIKNRMQEDNNIFSQKKHKFQTHNVTNSGKQKVLNALSSVPTTIEDILSCIDLDIQSLYFILIELELEDKISRISNNQVVLKYNEDVLN